MTNIVIDPEPSEDRIDYNGYAPISFDEHLQAVQQARSECPVVHSGEQGGFWLISRYADVRAVLSNPDIFSSRGGMALPRNPLRPPTPPIDRDGSEHREFRKIMNPFFTPAAVEAQTDTIRQIARDLVAGFIESGKCDFVRDYAHPFTAIAVARTIFGLDAGSEHEMVALRELVQDIGHERSGRDGVAQAWLAAQAFGARIIRDRAKDDGRADLVSAVMNATVDGVPLDLGMQSGLLALTMLGGLKTAASLLSTMVATGIAEPIRQAQLRDPNWVRSSIDEFLRLNPPIAWGGREVISAVAVAGVSIEAGEYVMCHFGSANRDGSEFDEPDEFDFDREGANRHLGFGFGVHRCVGAHMAKLEITIGITEFMNAVSNLRWQPGESGLYATGQEWGPDSFPVAFDPAAV